jgi:hypothetical protein
MAGDPDAFYDPYTDFVILPSKEVEIEDDKEKAISIVGSSLDMDEIHTDPSQHRVHVPIVSTNSDFCFIHQCDNFFRIVRFFCLFTCKSGFPAFLPFG